MFSWICSLFEEEKAPPVERRPLPKKPMVNDLKFALIRAHKVTSQGAMGACGLTEYDYYGEVLPRVVELSENTKEFSRSGKKIEDVIKEAVDWGADMIIEFGFSSSRGGFGDGAEAWIYGEPQRAMTLDLLVDWTVFSDKAISGGVKVAEGYHMTATKLMHEHGVAGCLFKPFHGDNPEDYVTPYKLERFLRWWINAKQTS